MYSDTQTVATPEMLSAMVTAEVGDEQRGTDPTVLELERRVAELLGQEAAVFLPSGTMCNAIAIRLHVGPAGDEIILHADAHPVDSECGGAAAMSGASMRLLESRTGKFSATQLADAIRAPDRYTPSSRLVVVEQTTGGGRVWRLDELDEVLAVAHTRGLRSHLDGARLMNAVVASDVPASEFARGFDTAWIDFAKGLGCPLGAVLAASDELVEQAWRYKQMWGGAMRQTGYVAAACLYALDNHVARLADDHENAVALATGLAALPDIEIDPSDVETNIVVFSVEDARTVAKRLIEVGVDLLVVDDRRLRAVTHMGVDRATVCDALLRIDRALQRAA